MTTFLPIFLAFGQSNEVGASALGTLSAADFLRLTGLSSSTLSQNPVNFTVPGTFWWKLKMPHGVALTFATTAAFGVNAITSVGSFGAATYDDRWVWVKTAATGAGQIRRIASHTADVLTLQAAPAWSAGTPTQPSTCEIWTDSETVSAATGTTITKTAATAAWTVNQHQGRWVTIISALFGTILQSARILSNTATVLTLDRSITAPLAGDGFRIATGGGVKDVADLISQGATSGKFEPLTINYELMTSYTSGYEYPSTSSSPRNAPALHFAAPVFMSFWEAMWGLQQLVGQQTYALHLAIGATPVSLVATTAPSVEGWSWYDGAKHNDWNVASTGTFAGTAYYDLLGILVDIQLANAQAWVAANIGADFRLDVRGIFCLEGESDAVDANRSSRFADNMRAVRKHMRARIGAMGLCSTDSNRIPFIPGTVHINTAVYPFGTTVNEALHELASEDHYTVVVDTTDLATSDNTHYTAASLVTIGQRRVAAWLQATQQESDATRPEADRMTLLEVRNQVKRRYERAGGSNTRDTVIDQFINDALRDLYNRPGDDCWFLRQWQPVTFSTYPESTLLPRTVTRPVGVEDPLCPGEMVPIRALTQEDSGRWRILVDSTNNPLNVHYVVKPRDVVQDLDPILLPRDYLELLVTSTCIRMSESTGNSGVVEQWRITAAGLLALYLQDCALYAQSQTQALVSIRQMTEDGTHVPPWVR